MCGHQAASLPADMLHGGLLCQAVLDHQKALWQLAAATVLLTSCMADADACVSFWCSEQHAYGSTDYR